MYGNISPLCIRQRCVVFKNWDSLQPNSWQEDVYLMAKCTRTPRKRKLNFIATVCRLAIAVLLPIKISTEKERKNMI